jgi:hypothetical protein
MIWGADAGGFNGRGWLPMIGPLQNIPLHRHSCRLRPQTVVLHPLPAHLAGARGGKQQRVEWQESFDLPERALPRVDRSRRRAATSRKAKPEIGKGCRAALRCGLTFEEIGNVLGISPRSVKRDWAVARVWLFKEIMVQKDAARRNMLYSSRR